MSRVTILAGILSIACGLRFGYDVFHPGANPMPIARPLSELPMDVVGPDWTGENIPLREDVEKRAGVDDHVKRIYRREDTLFSFYVGYVTGFKVGAVHNPDVCNLGAGYELVEKNIITIPPTDDSPQDSASELHFNEYTWRNPTNGSLVFTLSTFCFNGQFEPSELVVRANGWRANYFSVITIQGHHQGDMKRSRELYYEIARRSVPRILEHFPG